MGKELGLISEPPLIKLSNPPPPLSLWRPTRPKRKWATIQFKRQLSTLTSITIYKDRFPLPRKCRERQSGSERNDGFEKWNMNFRLEHSIAKNRATFSDVPLFPAGATQKGMFHSLFKGVFRKLLSTSGKQPQSRFPTHEGKFSLLPSSSPKGRP